MILKSKIIEDCHGFLSAKSINTKVTLSPKNQSNVTLTLSNVGANGLNQYELALANGFVGDYNSWLEYEREKMAAYIIASTENDWGRIATNIKYTGSQISHGDGNVLEGDFFGRTIYRYYTETTDSHGYPIEDSFYGSFSGNTLSDLISTRNIA